MDPASEFTDAERRVIAMFLHQSPSRFDEIFHYGAYVLPSVLFAAYAVSTESCVALLLAYVSLLTVVVLYLIYSRRSLVHMYSALRKYESRVRALDTHR
jgi:hypothetical protein